MSIAEKLTTIAENQRRVYDAGYEAGVSSSYDSGFLEGYNQGWEEGNEEGFADGEAVGKVEGKAEGIEEGKKAEYDKFWDAYQANGSRTKYSSGFAGDFWNDASFNPKYDIVIGSEIYDADMVFDNTDVTDLVSVLERNGVTLNTSQAVRFNATFRTASTKSLPTIDCSSATSMTMAFYNMPNLEALHLVNVRADCTFDRPIQYCYALTDLTISGTIGNNIDITGCTKLTHDSLMSIINALENKASGTWTCKLTATNLAKLTDAEKAIATQKGWTLA